jgi:hypothetical protein
MAHVACAPLGDCAQTLRPSATALDVLSAVVRGRLPATSRDYRDDALLCTRHFDTFVAHYNDTHRRRPCIACDSDSGGNGTNRCWLPLACRLDEHRVRRGLLPLAWAVAKGVVLWLCEQHHQQLRADPLAVMCWSGACKSCGAAKLVDCPHERKSKQRCTWYQLVGTPRTRVQSTGTIGELWSLFKRKLLELREHYYRWWHQYWTTKRMRCAAALTAPGGGNNVYVHVDASAKYEHEHMREVHQRFLTRERTGIVVCRMRTQRHLLTWRVCRCVARTCCAVR